MSIQIEEGKYYRTRTGGKRGPVGENRTGEYVTSHPWRVGARTYTSDGSWGGTGQPQDDEDLVAEWVNEPETAHDPVEHPKHYTGHPSGVECIAITEHMNFCLGNAVKYIWRAGEKGDALTDLKKARWYVDREIERLSKNA